VVLQDVYARLPDVAITDKNDTFHLRGESYGTFRLMARVVKRDMYGNLTPVEGIPPAISKKFIVSACACLTMSDTLGSIGMTMTGIAAATHTMPKVQNAARLSMGCRSRHSVL
jgi:hypothetical protein